MSLTDLFWSTGVEWILHLKMSKTRLYLYEKQCIYTYGIRVCFSPPTPIQMARVNHTAEQYRPVMAVGRNAWISCVLLNICNSANSSSSTWALHDALKHVSSTKSVKVFWIWCSPKNWITKDYDSKEVGAKFCRVQNSGKNMHCVSGQIIWCCTTQAYPLTISCHSEKQPRICVNVKLKRHHRIACLIQTDNKSVCIIYVTSSI